MIENDISPTNKIIFLAIIGKNRSDLKHLNLNKTLKLYC